MIVLFIGSFNPVTKGHQEIIERIKQLETTEKVIIVPVSDSYQKDSLNTSFDDRKKMLELVFDDEVSDFENERDYQVKTLITLNYFKNLYNSEIAIVIGADNLAEFNQWYRYDEILKNYYVIVLNRQDDLSAIINNDEILKKYQNHLIIMNDFNIKISSSTARKNINSDYLDPRVVQYIKENNLYQNLIEGDNN